MSIRDHLVDHRPVRPHVRTHSIGGRLITPITSSVIVCRRGRAREQLRRPVPRRAHGGRHGKLGMDILLLHSRASTSCVISSCGIPKSNKMLMSTFSEKNLADGRRQTLFSVRPFAGDLGLEGERGLLRL